jgi:hypothetical protein
MTGKDLRRGERLSLSLIYRRKHFTAAVEKQQEGTGNESVYRPEILQRGAGNMSGYLPSMSPSG